MGQPGDGFKIAMRGLNGGRINVGECITLTCPGIKSYYLYNVYLEVKSYSIILYYNKEEGEAGHSGKHVGLVGGQL